ncbi:hypothetical protein GGI35DRAFT_95706 [Trichoderma velutinum]
MLLREERRVRYRRHGRDEGLWCRENPLTARETWGSQFQMVLPSTKRRAMTDALQGGQRSTIRLRPTVCPCALGRGVMDLRDVSLGGSRQPQGPWGESMVIGLKYFKPVRRRLNNQISTCQVQRWP